MPTSPHDEGRSILNNLPSPDEVPNLPDAARDLDAWND